MRTAAFWPPFRVSGGVDRGSVGWKEPQANSTIAMKTDAVVRRAGGAAMVDARPPVQFASLFAPYDRRTPRPRCAAHPFTVNGRENEPHFFETSSRMMASRT
jgi:hypothetical protein